MEFYGLYLLKWKKIIYHAGDQRLVPSIFMPEKPGAPLESNSSSKAWSGVDCLFVVQSSHDSGALVALTCFVHVLGLHIQGWP